MDEREIGGARAHVFPTKADIVEHLVGRFAELVRTSVAQRGRCLVALAGGSTPRALYEALASRAADLPWSAVHVLFGDERHVPPEHADSNYRMASDALLGKVEIPAANVHRIEAERPADEAAERYEQSLRELGDGTTPRLDLALLGMGDDGHTASLFPGTSATAERKRLVIAPWVDKFQTHRITMTVPVFNAAAEVWFLVAGAGKAERLVEVLTGPRDVDRLPSQAIEPTGGARWFLDEAAAARLPA